MRGITLSNIMGYKVLTQHTLTGTRFLDFSNDARFVITDRTYQCLGKAKQKLEAFIALTQSLAS